MGKDSSVHPLVKNIIVIALAVPPLLVLWGVGVAVAGVGYGVAVGRVSPELSSLPGVLDSELAVLGAAAAVGYVYLIWANVVFGTSNVETAKEQAQSIKSDAEGLEE